MDIKSLADKAIELTAKAQAIKTPDEAQKFAHDAVAAFRDAKEEIAKTDAKSILAMLLPFMPAQWRPIVGTLTTVLGLFGGGFGLSEALDQPDAINVTIPAETQAKLDEAARAASEITTAHREQFEAAVKKLEEAQAAMKAAADKKFVIRGYDKDNRTVTELDFFRQPPR